VVDDSIVRGNTTRQIVQMLRDAGAAEVHMRISAPPIKHPCHYGVDMSTTEEMVAHGRSVEEISEHLGCDSLAYLSLPGVYEAVRGEPRAPLRRLLHGRVPPGGHGGARGQVRLRALASRPQRLMRRAGARFVTRLRRRRSGPAGAAGAAAKVGRPR
jgi:hypothetical protein